MAYDDTCEHCGIPIQRHDDDVNLVCGKIQLDLEKKMRLHTFRALEKYACHMDSCEAYADGPDACTCGMMAALRGLEPIL